MLSLQFLLLITDDYMELINILRHISDGIVGGFKDSSQEIAHQKRITTNSRVIFHSKALGELFSKGLEPQALLRDKKAILFGRKSPEIGTDEFFELSIVKVY